MKILFPLTVLLLLPHFFFAQMEKTEVSITTQGRTRLEVLQQLEKQTGIPFYYIPEWFDNTPIADELSANDLGTLLESLLEGTDFNYYYYDGKKVVLTKGQLIYDYLPEGFFPKQRTNDSIPVSSEEENAALSVAFQNQQNQRNTKRTVTIGKQQKGNISNAFKLSGIVRTAETGASIPNVLVRIEGGKNTVTDQKGFYTLSVPAGKATLLTDAIGLERLNQPIIVYGNGTLDLVVSEQIEQLQEVVLRANNNADIQETEIGSSNIGSEESKTIPVVLGERDLLKVATTLPGITSAGEGAAGYNVRGGKTDQNLILLDGSTLYNPSHFFGIFSALNPFTVESVDIFKGNIPAEYGGRLSSVFNIKTIDAKTEKIQGEASIGPVTGNIMVQAPIWDKKGGVLIGARGTYSDWILNAIDEPSLQGRNAYFYDIVAKYNHTLNDNNAIEATAYFSKDAFSITQDSLYGYENRLATLKWNHVFNEKHRGSAKLSYNEYRFNIDFEGRPEVDFAFDYGIRETQLKVKMDYRLHPKHALSYGIESKLYSLEPGAIQGLTPESQIQAIKLTEEHGLESALFVSDKIDFSEAFELNLGVRLSMFNAIGPSEQRVYEANEPRTDTTVERTESFEKGDFFKTYLYPELRIGARYTLQEDLSVKASINNTVQYLHSLSNNTTVSPIDTYTLSDTNIRPQQAWFASTGLFKNFAEEQYTLSLEGFYKRLSDVLDFKTGAQLLLNENVETETLQGDGESYGAELLLRKNYGKLNGWLGYTYSRSFYRFQSDIQEETINSGAYFPSNFDKPHDISFVANYEVSKRISFSTNFIYQTGRPVTIPTGTFTFDGQQQVLYSARNQFRIPDYYRLDLGFNLEGNHKKDKLAHSFWNISIYNVLGRNNPYSVFFVTDSGEVKAFQSAIFNIPVPSITYNIKF
ncbi:TonB-dependent receptor [Maribacter sp. 2-571]|uniref:TonB-dependent receptor n=1 Tax=Maribacter sp. 2-571 TaxID=3417569 RepID=UPI003D349287